MKLVNKAERRIRLVQFGALYIFSVIAVIGACFVLFRGQQRNYQTISHPDRAFGSSERSIDSLRNALSTVEGELLERDSLLAMMRRQPVSIPPPATKAENMGADDEVDHRLLGDLKHRNTLALDTITLLRNRIASIAQMLEDKQKATEILSEQIAMLRHSTETLQARLKEGGNTPSEKEASIDATDTRIKSLVKDKATLEKQFNELSDQLRFAEVDCNLSRADARQVVYSDRQRQDLLANALRILTDLSKSLDPGVQQKAKEKLALLKNIAGMVHD